MKLDRWFLVDGGRGTCHALYIDNLVDALISAGQKREVIGEAILITDGHPHNWAEFFGHYARVLGIRELSSIDVSTARFMLLLTKYMDGLLSKLDHTPGLEPSRTIVRALRRGIHLIRRLPKRYVGPIDAWDLMKYARQGGLNISKARTLLGYTPRFTLEEGMRETEIWLRDQRLI